MPLGHGSFWFTNIYCKAKYLVINRINFVFFFFFFAFSRNGYPRLSGAAVQSKGEEFALTFTLCNAVFYLLVTFFSSFVGGLATKYCHHREICGQVQQGKSVSLS